jgi:hypothetical protein
VVEDIDRLAEEMKQMKKLPEPKKRRIISCWWMKPSEKKLLKRA